MSEQTESKSRRRRRSSKSAELKSTDQEEADQLQREEQDGKKDGTALEEPVPERLEPDPNALDVEWTKITNDVSYYQRRLDAAEDAAREADNERRKVRAEVFKDILNNGTKYGLPKDNPGGNIAEGVVRGIPAVVEAERHFNWCQFKRDHYKGVMFDFMRKQDALSELHALWRRQYFAGPENLPRHVMEEMQEHRMNKMEELTGNQQFRGE